MDLNDELQRLHDFSCFNLFKKRVKKGRKYKEWKKDEIRETDAEGMKFLEKQIHRMRKKEEHQVHRKNVTKRNTGGVANNNNNHLTHGAAQNVSGACDTGYGRPVSTTNHNNGNQ